MRDLPTCRHLLSTDPPPDATEQMALQYDDDQEPEYAQQAGVESDDDLKVF